MVSIGIDLGGTNIKIALVDQKKGGSSTQLLFPTRAELGKNQIFDTIKEQYLNCRIKKQCGANGYWNGACRGWLALIAVLYAIRLILPGWKREDVASEIEKRLDLRCTIDNDANLAALGSARFGVAKPIRQLYYDYAWNRRRRRYYI